jgi:hypothetical protein
MRVTDTTTVCAFVSCLGIDTVPATTGRGEPENSRTFRIFGFTSQRGPDWPAKLPCMAAAQSLRRHIY